MVITHPVPSQIPPSCTRHEKSRLKPDCGVFRLFHRQNTHGYGSLLSPIYKVAHGHETPHLIRGIKGVYPKKLSQKNSIWGPQRQHFITVAVRGFSFFKSLGNDEV